MKFKFLKIKSRSSCPRRFSLSVFAGWLLIAFAGSLHAQEPALDAGDPGAPQTAKPPAVQWDLMKWVRSESDGTWIASGKLIEVLRIVDPNVFGEWDGLLGVFRLRALGRNVQLLSSRPLLIIDGQTFPQSAALRTEGGSVLIPVETARQLIERLTAGAQTQGPGAAGDPASGEPDPDAAWWQALNEPEKPSVPADLFQTPGDAFPGGEAEAPVDFSRELEALSGGAGGRESGSLLAPPATGLPSPIKASDAAPSVAGLSWVQLVDSVHSRPPTSMTLVYDAALSDLARRVEALLARSIALDIEMLAVEKRRDDPKLLSAITSSRPDLLVDLMAAEGEGGADAATTGFEVWAVHEALWPDAMGEPEAQARAVHEFYRIHQFHNLALGATIREELVKNFPHHTVELQMAPAWLLRRIDAPAAGVVLPGRLVTINPEELDIAARALAQGVINYYRGFTSVLR